MTTIRDALASYVGLETMHEGEFIVNHGKSTMCQVDEMCRRLSADGDDHPVVKKEAPNHYLVVGFNLKGVRHRVVVNQSNDFTRVESICNIEGSPEQVLSDLITYLIKNPSNGFVENKQEQSRVRLTDTPIPTSFRIATERRITREGLATLRDQMGTEVVLDFHIRLITRFSLGFKHMRLDVSTTRSASMLTKVGQAPAVHEVEVEVEPGLKKKDLDEATACMTHLLAVYEGSHVMLTQEAILDVVTEVFHTVQCVRGRSKRHNKMEFRKPVAGTVENTLMEPPGRWITHKADGVRAFLVYSPKQGRWYIIFPSNLRVISGPSMAKGSAPPTGMVLMDGEFCESLNALFLFDAIFHNDRQVIKDPMEQRIHLVQEVYRTYFARADGGRKKKDAWGGNVCPWKKDKLDAPYQAWSDAFAAQTAAVARARAGAKTLDDKTAMAVFPKQYVDVGAKATHLQYFQAMGDLIGLLLKQEGPEYVNDGVIVAAKNPSQPDLKIKEHATVDFFLRLDDPTARCFDNTLTEEKDQQFCPGQLYARIGTRGHKLFAYQGLQNVTVPYNAEGTYLIDLDGSPVYDKTVVECLLVEGDWKIMRSRPDKTHGNHEVVAKATIDCMFSFPWTSIHLLANAETHEAEKERLIGQFAQSLNAKAGKESAPETEVEKQLDVRRDDAEAGVEKKGYYAVENRKGGEMSRRFHGTIVEHLLREYCPPNATVFDGGTGRGGNHWKMFGAGVQACVGIDADSQNLKEWMRRLNEVKARGHDVSRFKAFHGRFDVPFTSQSKRMQAALGEVSFDVAFYSFSMHYAWGTKATVDAFAENQKQLNADVVIITTTDGQKLHEAHKKHGAVFPIGDHYRYEFDKKRRVKFENIKHGFTVGFHNANFMLPDQVETEFLVTEKHLKSVMRKCKYDCILTKNFADYIPDIRIEQQFKNKAGSISKRDEAIQRFMVLPDTHPERVHSSMYRAYVFKKKKATRKRASKKK